MTGLTLTLVRSLPIVGMIGVGFLLRQLRLMRQDDGHTMVRAVVNTTLPALVFTSLVHAQIELRTLLMFALAGAVLSLVLHAVALAVTRACGWPPRVAGVVVLCALVGSVGMFLSPFIMTFYGQEYMGRVAALDFGNTLLASSYGYYVAVRFGTQGNWRAGPTIKRMLFRPVIWACLLGIALNLAHVQISGPLSQMLDTLAAANVPLAMLTLGLFVELRVPNWRPALMAAVLRMGLGWLVGQALVRLLGLGGVDQIVLGLGAAMPIGVLALIHASTEGLDTELAAAALSFSIVIGAVATPLLLSLYA